EENKSLANALFHNLVDIPITTPTSCGHQSSHPGSSRNHTGGGSSLKRVLLQAPLISERKSRRQCHFCMDRRVCSTCCKCGKLICKDHSLSICSPCST
ncbi:hypothetical protein KUCAC02_026680, partial [Chaenocephalus aceratus]